MNEYNLMTKSGEKVNKTKSESLEFAIEFFARLKNIKVTDLLKIYNVKES